MIAHVLKKHGIGEKKKKHCNIPLKKKKKNCNIHLKKKRKNCNIHLKKKKKKKKTNCNINLKKKKKTTKKNCNIYLKKKKKKRRNCNFTIFSPFFFSSGHLPEDPALSLECSSRFIYRQIFHEIL